MSDIRKEGDASQVPDNHIPLDSMPNILETVPPPLEFQEDRLKTQEHSKRGKTFALIAGGVTLLGVGLGVGMATGGEDEPRDNEVVVDEGSVSSETTLDTTTETAVTTTEPEIISETSDFEPILITATTPQELFDQFEHNYLCMYNAPDYADQERCAEFILGDGSGALTEDYRLRIADMNEYRINHPEYMYEWSTEVMDSRMTDVEAILIVNAEDHTGPFTQRYTFRQQPVSVEQAEIENTVTSAWVLLGTELLNPGEVSFE